uniref:Cullin-3 n=1 Tax=Cajanus cajan TaxID=3821 RepID=A0A151TFT7_CAJCA|nr:Cullin-3 [Cajanus cajan]
MVFHKFGEKLYSGLTAHLKEIARSIEATLEGSFLEEMNRKWSDHNKASDMIRDIMMYMDRTYIPDAGPSVYEQEFETHFLQVSAEFYRAESQKFIECCACGDYLKNSEKRLNKEMDRVNHYLDPGTGKKITNVVKKEMIENYMLILIHKENSGLVSMLCYDKYDDLGRMYNLFRRVTDSLSKILEVMTSHNRESGKQLVTDPERLKDPVEFVQRLLDEKEKYDKIINLAFNKDGFFQNALNSSFEYFINLNPRFQEFISLFVDDKVRQGLNGVTLDKVMMLFR